MWDIYVGWKACVRQKRTANSNLAHSANDTEIQSVSKKHLV